MLLFIDKLYMTGAEYGLSEFNEVENANYFIGRASRKISNLITLPDFDEDEFGNTADGLTDKQREVVKEATAIYTDYYWKNDYDWTEGSTTTSVGGTVYSETKTFDGEKIIPNVYEILQKYDLLDTDESFAVVVTEDIDEDSNFAPTTEGGTNIIDGVTKLNSINLTKGVNDPTPNLVTQQWVNENQSNSGVTKDYVDTADQALETKITANTTALDAKANINDIRYSFRIAEDEFQTPNDFVANTQEGQLIETFLPVDNNQSVLWKDGKGLYVYDKATKSYTATSHYDIDKQANTYAEVIDVVIERDEDGNVWAEDAGVKVPISRKVFIEIDSKTPTYALITGHFILVDNPITNDFTKYPIKGTVRVTDTDFDIKEDIRYANDNHIQLWVGSHNGLANVLSNQSAPFDFDLSEWDMIKVAVQAGQVGGGVGDEEWLTLSTGGGGIGKMVSDPITGFSSTRAIKTSLNISATVTQVTIQQILFENYAYTSDTGSPTISRINPVTNTGVRANIVEIRGIRKK